MYGMLFVAAPRNYLPEKVYVHPFAVWLGFGFSPTQRSQKNSFLTTMPKIRRFLIESNLFALVSSVCYHNAQINALFHVLRV
jgi:hypothetical protein